MILFSPAGGAGVGVVKVAADDVKLCDCNSGPAWLMPIITFSLWKGSSRVSCVYSDKEFSPAKKSLNNVSEMQHFSFQVFPEFVKFLFKDG